jgi:Fe-S-cluster containining protein
MKDDYQEIDKLFFDEGYKMASQYLSEGLTPANVIILMTDIYVLINSLLESFTEKVKSEKKIIDCQKGCHWCCAQTVYANPLEIHLLTRFIKNNFPKKEQKIFHKRAEEKHQITSKLDSDGKLQHRQFCPLLDKNICSVYMARPTACRIYLSMNLESCRENFGNPENKKIFPQLYALPLHVGRMLNEGIAAWLAEKNLYLKEDTLEAGISYFLKNDIALKEWLNAGIE